MLNSFIRCQSDHNGHFMALSKHSHRQVMRVRVQFFINEFHIEALSYVRRYNFHVNFCECLAKTHSLATIKRTEAKWVSLFTIWCQRQRTFKVKSVGKELFWLLPLGRVFVQTIEISKYVHTCFDVVLSNLCILTQCELRSNRYNRHNSKSFHDNCAKEGLVLAAFNSAASSQLC